MVAFWEVPSDKAGKKWKVLMEFQIGHLKTLTLSGMSSNRARTLPYSWFHH